MQRRELLRIVGNAAVAVTAGGCSGNRSAYRMFSSAEAETLAALVNQIIPDDQTPGAVWANVLRFLDRQIAHAYGNHRETYRLGLAALERSAQSVYQRRFAALDFLEQEALVERMETGNLPADLWSELRPQEFFRILRTHTMQGFYGDPRHGGNRDLVSWRMLGVPYPPVRGRDDYRFPKHPAPSQAHPFPAEQRL